MITTDQKLDCYHCGQPCNNEQVMVGDKAFCCHGCKVVYEVINENNLCDYYNIETHPGLKAGDIRQSAYEHLDEPGVRKKLLEFDSEDFALVRFTIPSIHCSSCIWLLENLPRANRGVIRSEVNFNRKEVRVDFDPRKTSLSDLASLLDAIGYAPKTLTEDVPRPGKGLSPLVLKLAIAGFAFGNIMLFSFPEYLGLGASDHTFSRLFSWLNLFLSLPVILYSASGYFASATRSFRQRQINIDVPIALGLLALFCRSAYDIITQTGPGYLDSLSGLVFFLLIGRWFQSRTYESLAFERDFRSFFPMAVQRVVDGGERSTVIFDLRKGDKIRIRNFEIVPADSVLEDGNPFIDYSFVTGESKPVRAVAGDLIYAGGRLLGQPVTLIVEKETSQSHLTALWNKEGFRKRHESNYRKIIDRSAKVFTWIVLGIAAVTALYWYLVSPAEMWLIITSVLMVACPCALALAAPFTYGSMMSAFGRHGLYLKNADVVERLGVVDSIIFDKTGTVTHGQTPEISVEGNLSAKELANVKLLTSFSTHPLSSLVSGFITEPTTQSVDQFDERPGRGITGVIGGRTYKIGSAAFLELNEVSEANGSRVYVSIDALPRACFVIKTAVRRDIRSMLSRLRVAMLALISGDSESEKSQMTALFPERASLRFNQRPGDKMTYISDLQGHGNRVLMVGDGLNDAGALKQADVGIAVTDDSSLFTPGCDAIMMGDQLKNLDRFISLAKSSSLILKIAFTISFLYNAVALGFAVTGHLTPLVAAILMPISSISVVGFSTIAVNREVTRKLGNLC